MIIKLRFTFSWFKGNCNPGNIWNKNTSICVSNTNLVVCGGNTLNIDCGLGRINIINIFYGRKTTSVCGLTDCVNSGIPLSTCTTAVANNLNCSSSNAIIAIKNVCNGQMKCSIAITNTALNGDPCGGTYKYAIANYTCYNPPAINASNVTTAIVCEGSYLTLNCGSNRINVTKVFFGRMTNTICGYTDCVNSGLPGGLCSIAVNNNLNCSASSVALTTIKNSCNNKEMCAILSGFIAFGTDPCTGTYKYGTITYDCVPPVPVNTTNTTLLVCEKRNLVLDCGVNRIKVKYAFFGRKNSTICGYTDCVSVGIAASVCTTAVTNNLNCNSSIATSFLQNLCDYSQFCNLTVGAAAFNNNDPCSGTYKYAYVDYTCINISTTTPVYTSTPRITTTKTIPSIASSFRKGLFFKSLILIVNNYFLNFLF